MANVTLAAAIKQYLNEADLAPTTRTVYGATLRQLTAVVGCDTAIETVDADALRAHLSARNVAPATHNRELAAIKALFGWAHNRGHIDVDPAGTLSRRRLTISSEAQRRRKPIPRHQINELLTNRRRQLRDRTLWALAYESAARANELLGLNIEDLDPTARTAIVVGKGGHRETIHWGSLTASLLRQHLATRQTHGPVFVADKRSHNTEPASMDRSPVSGAPRLSYRRAAAVFSAASGHTLHQLRHSRLTHLAEDGEDAMLLKALSRHRSIRSLDQYVAPGDAAIQRLVDRHDPRSTTRR